MLASRFSTRTFTGALLSALAVIPPGKAADIDRPPAAPRPSDTVVTLRNIEQRLVPSKVVRGDREFGGNGPDITANVTLSVTGDQRRILATVDFRAKETKADWSETHGSWTHTVYTAPGSHTIERIVDTSSSTVRFVSQPAGAQLFGPSEDFAKLLEGVQKVAEAMLLFSVPGTPTDTAAKREMKRLNDLVLQGTAYLPSQGNHVHLKAPSAGPVQLFAIVGDTGGPDISTDDDPKDDTRIDCVRFKPLKIRLR